MLPSNAMPEKNSVKRREQARCKFYMKFDSLSRKKIWERGHVFNSPFYSEVSVKRGRMFFSQSTPDSGGLPRPWVYVYMSKLCHSRYNYLDSLVILCIFQGQTMIFQSKLQWNRECQCTRQCSGCRCLRWMGIFSSARWQLLCSLLCSDHHTP